MLEFAGERSRKTVYRAHGVSYKLAAHDDMSEKLPAVGVVVFWKIRYLKDLANVMENSRRNKKVPVEVFISVRQKRTKPRNA